MSENPFKIIRSTDQPPGDLRKEVMGSVKLMMLLMRFIQLFVADPAPAMFEKVRLAGRTRNKNVENGTTDGSEPTSKET
ncbi:MAG: hypothetical protein R2818_14240 [Flavobacteriales bacterium]